MKKSLLTLFTAMAIGLTLPSGVHAQREAFPGAEGYGRLTTGGRGGAVYHVTRLDDDSQPGSFRYACERSGARTIVFDVDGVIHLKRELRLNKGNVTIAGQTAPGDGVCVSDYPFTIAADNVIIRFMRFRLGNEAIKTNKNAHEGDGLGGMDRKNIIVDHCSVSWSIDECLSVYGSTDITVQWCIASHSLQNAGHSKGSHGYGGNWGGRRASYHHNLIANHASRTPRLGPRPDTQTEEQMDMRNNVIYNYGNNGCYGGEGMNVNIVNNYYKPGKTGNSRKGRIAGLGIRTLSYCIDLAATATNYNKVAGTSYTKDDISLDVVKLNSEYVNRIRIEGKPYIVDRTDYTIDVNGTKVKLALNGWGPMLHKWGTYYVKGNYNPSSTAATADNWNIGIYNEITASSNDYLWNDQIKQDIRLDTPIEYIYTTTHTAEKAFDKVLTYAGASLHRDEYDRIVTDDARKGTASFTATGLIDSQDQITYSDGSTGWPKLNSGTAKTDTDGDGIPDEWEMANNLDPEDPNDGKTITRNGYTNLEIYMNSLVEDIMMAGNADGKLLSGNLEESDPAVTLPEYIHPVTPGPEVGLDYEISNSTHDTNDAGGTEYWTFGDAKIEANGKTYGNKNNLLKLSRNHDFGITVPDGLVITGVSVTGCMRTETGDIIFKNGTDEIGRTKTFQDEATGGTEQTDKVTFSSPTSTNKVTFRISGQNQGYFSFNVHTAKTSGIEDIVVDNDVEEDGRIFNMMGIEVKAPLAPGIYISNGKKFIVK